MFHRVNNLKNKFVIYINMRTLLTHILRSMHDPKPLLGRWSLKHKCRSEDITVFNANRDHCGDALCGKSEQYKVLKDTLVDRK